MKLIKSLSPETKKKLEQIFFKFYVFVPCLFVGLALALNLLFWVLLEIWFFLLPIPFWAPFPIAVYFGVILSFSTFFIMKCYEETSETETAAA